MAVSATASYPVRLEIDPAATQGRWTVFFRILMLFPHLIVFGAINGALATGAIIAWFAIVFAGRYPDSLLRFQIGLHRWNARLNAYQLLLTGAFPPFGVEPEESYPVRLQVDERALDRNRLTTFFRVFLIIPHLIVVAILGFVASILVFISWFIALFTGSVPDGLHNFVAGYHRWNTRYSAYAFLLVDDYPPFRLE